MTADGRGVASHAGTRPLTDLAAATGLTRAFAEALGDLRQRGSGMTRARWRSTWRP